MKKFNLVKGISTAAVALALCLGFTGTVQAAQLDKSDIAQTELTQVGAPATPSISIARTIRSGETTTAWEISHPKVPQGYILVFNIYANGNRKDSVNGRWYKDNNGVEYFEPYGYDWGYHYDYIQATDTRSYHVYADCWYAADEYDSTTLTIDYGDFEPGTYNIEAYFYQYVWNKVTEMEYDYWDDTYYPVTNWTRVGDPSYNANYRSAASKAISISVGLDAPYVDVAVKSTSVQLDMSRSNETGYEVYRKVGKKFTKIANITKGTYTDSGLTSDTAYQYRVRSYYYNTKTKKTIYSPYTMVECTTNGSALKLRATLTGKKNVKLTWNKIPGAIRYDVYRTRAGSKSTERSKGYYNGYSSEDLLKSLGKGKKTYTDKKTTANNNYTYTVVAVLKSGKEQVVDAVGVNIAFTAPDVWSYTNASGVKTVEWEKVYGADGYLLEKYDSKTGNWVTAQKLGKNTTKKTFKFTAYYNTAEKNWVTSEQYRLRATKGNAVSDYDETITVSATLGVVSNVTAKKVSNGIQVSWSAVPGATFYRVYRAKAGSHMLYKDSNSYSQFGTQVTEYIGVVAPQARPAVAGNTTTYYYQNFADSQTYTTSTTMLDYAGDIYWDGDSEPYTVGPQEGVTYQYCVVAYKAETLEPNKNYSVYNTTTHQWTTTVKARYGRRYYYDVGTSYEGYSDSEGSAIYSSMGCKKLGEATYTSVAAPGKTKIKSLSTSKKTVTVKFKKVKGATSYKIYRSTKKKGKYLCVGTSKKVTFKDTGLETGKTYYYKVVAVKAAESGADIEGKASAVKSIKAK